MFQYPGDYWSSQNTEWSDYSVPVHTAMSTLKWNFTGAIFMNWLKPDKLLHALKISYISFSLNKIYNEIVIHLFSVKLWTWYFILWRESKLAKLAKLVCLYACAKLACNAQHQPKKLQVFNFKSWNYLSFLLLKSGKILSQYFVQLQWAWVGVRMSS